MYIYLGYVCYNLHENKETYSKITRISYQFPVILYHVLDTLLQIQGAEGNCGGENVTTDLFKTITVDPEGNILFEKVEKFDPFIEGVILVDNVKESNVHTRVITRI